MNIQPAAPGTLRIAAALTALRSLTEDQIGAAATAVEFPATVRADTVDVRLAHAFQAAEKNGAHHFDIDLSATRFVEPAALQMLIASILDLKQRRHDVTLRIPRDHRVRDFLRAWGFPVALNAVLGTDAFQRLTATGDRRYFNEARAFYKPASLPAHPGFPGSGVRSSNFFGFHTEWLDHVKASPRLAYEEKDAWNAAHIRDILTKKFGGKSSYFASRVIFEATLNALRHPGARVLQTASIDSPVEVRRGSFFTTHFWDDGLSMVETLRTAVDRRVSVRGEGGVEFRRKYLVVTSEDDHPTRRCYAVEDADCNLEPGLPPERALFATILPGVTSDPLGENHAVLPEIVAENPRYGRRGMGLFVLTNAVVEVLGGSVAFRTGRYHMSVRKTNAFERTETGATIRVRIKKRPSALPPFRGNLVVVRLRTPEAV